MIIVTINGPSIFGEDVMTMKQRAAQNRVRSMHWVLVSGLRIDCIYNNSRGGVRKPWMYPWVTTSPLLMVNFSLFYGLALTLALFLFFYYGIDTCYCRDIYDVAYRAFNVGKVDRFVQSHLDRAYNFCFTHVLYELICGVG